ncbi:MAG: thioredoxin-dependent thiol peroxidase [Phycisphaerales bacterium]
MPLIDVGKKAPAFRLKDQTGTDHALADYAGRPLVLFFYPKDMTSGCTQEACAFRDLSGAFERAGARVVGISILGVKSKAKFAARDGIGFPLLADDRVDDAGKPDPEVAQKYGVWVEKSMYGRRYMGIVRTTYLIDRNGRVARRWDNVKVPGHAEEVLAAVRELK